MSSYTKTSGRPAWVSVNLSAIQRNIIGVRRWVGPETGVYAVVKANAYGHGLCGVAHTVLHAGAAGVAVAIPEEGIALRNEGVTDPILVLGICLPSAAQNLVQYGLDSILSTPELLAALSEEACRQNLPARVHVAVDSGMSRVGLLPERLAPFLQAVTEAPGVEWTGLMTHFAASDEEDLASAHDQWSRFRQALDIALAARRTPDPLLVHAANSGAICRMPETYRDLPAGVQPMVRSGLLTYGIPPAPVGPCPSLTPALSVMARVTQARDVPAGSRISYGGTFTTRRPSRLAIVPLGYADGYSRANSNRASVLLRGCRVPVLGRVCMDQFVIDATDTGAEIGDEIVLIGRQGNDEITLQEAADWSQTIHHEVLSRLSNRLPRVYEQ